MIAVAKLKICKNQSADFLRKPEGLIFCIFLIFLLLVMKKVVILHQLLKHRHSFLNGHGRLRTALFLMIKTKVYATKSNFLHRWI